MPLVLFPYLTADPRLQPSASQCLDEALAMLNVEYKKARKCTLL